jgi:hypothetical protein
MNVPGFLKSTAGRYFGQAVENTTKLMRRRSLIFIAGCPFP